MLQTAVTPLRVLIFGMQDPKLVKIIIDIYKLDNGETRCISYITHWGRVTHICVGKLTIIGSGNGLSPGRRQANIWTNAGILLIRPSGTNSNENLIEIHTFSLKKIHLKMPSGKWRPFCFGLNVISGSYSNHKNKTLLVRRYKLTCFQSVYVDMLDTHSSTQQPNNNNHIDLNMTIVCRAPQHWYTFWMMTSSNGNTFRVPGYRWIPRTKSSDTDFPY